MLAADDISPNDGLGALLASAARLPEGPAIAAAVEAGLAAGPALAMVDSDRGITNLHVPRDVIVDASMPAMIRTSGHMWGPDGKEDDTLAVIPDSSYAGVYQVVIDDCRAHGAFDPATMGSVPNVGLMAQAAEEYGSHDKTFEIPAEGTVRVVDGAGNVLIEHDVQAGDIWRACQTKDVPIRDWVKLAVTRARATGAPAVFWLDEGRAHDANLIAKVNAYLPDHDTDGARDPDHVARWRPPQFSLERIRRGEDTISVTGNVLRDYLTDLFPIMELGTSAKMLSIVPLINGGGLFETGAGGSAPKHVQQLVKENYLRWDSLGEFLALAVELRAARRRDRQQAGPGAGRHARSGHGHVPRREQVAALAASARSTTAAATSTWPCTGRRSWPARPTTPRSQRAFAPLAETPRRSTRRRSSSELLAVQGSPADIGGYYRPDADKTTAVMRPSATFNEALAAL